MSTRWLSGRFAAVHESGHGTKRTSDAQPFAYAINGTARHYPKLRSPVADHAAALAIVGMDRLSFQYPRLAVGRRHGRHNGQRHLRTGPTCPLMRACPNSTAAVIPMPAREAWAGLLRGCPRWRDRYEERQSGRLRSVVLALRLLSGIGSWRTTGTAATFQQAPGAPLRRS